MDRIEDRPTTDVQLTATCEWCGEQIVHSGIWTSNSGGDYCPEGQDVGPTGTSPHKPEGAAPLEAASPSALDVERLRRTFTNLDLTISVPNDWKGSVWVWPEVADEYARLAHPEGGGAVSDHPTPPSRAPKARNPDELRRGPTDQGVGQVELDDHER